MAREKSHLALEKDSVCRKTGARGVSGNAGSARSGQTQRTRLAAYLAELDRDHGPIDSRVRQEVHRDWRGAGNGTTRRQTVRAVRS
jgi:hypothetical protein